MLMRRVDRCELRPFLCLDGTQPTDMECVDTLVTWSTPGRVYLSGRMVRDAAALFGMVAAEDHAVVVAELEELKAKLAEAEGEVAELAEVKNAITRAQARYESDDERPARPSRPPRKRVAA